MCVLVIAKKSFISCEVTKKQNKQTINMVCRRLSFQVDLKHRKFICNYCHNRLTFFKQKLLKLQNMIQFQLLICCFLCLVNWIFQFWTVGWTKWKSEGITLGFRKLWWAFFLSFLQSPQRVTVGVFFLNYFCVSVLFQCSYNKLPV